MDRYDRIAHNEVTTTIERAGFELLTPEEFRVEITDSFKRRRGECKQESAPTDGSGVDTTYVIRLARRLFTDGQDDQWRDTVRHEVAHAYVFKRFGDEVDPHGEEWKEAARRAGADPKARYEGPDESVDPDFILACPNDCFERGYLKRAKRVKNPWGYTCPECETQLISYDAGARPSDPAPGRCYVASLPWTTPIDKGTTDADNAAYVLACPNTCAAWPYQQRSKRIKNPWLYSCPECGTALISYDADARPVAPDPGTCYVASIPWDTPRYIHACANGCFTAGYGDEPTEIQTPSNYRCNDCGTATISYPTGERPTDPTPGTRYLDS